MSANSRVSSLVAGAILAIAVVSCGDDANPVRPSGTSNPPPAGPATVTRVDTVIPTSLEPGVSARATASATMSDGSVRDVTSEAQWSSSNSRVVQAAPSGALVAGERGEAIVIARMGSRSSSGRIFVLPAATFRLTGVISEAGEPLNGVRVEVIEGTGQGLTAVTNTQGQFAIYGVAGHVRLHAKKDGFVNGTQDVDVNDHQSVNVEMRFDGARPRQDGVYSLEIAAEGCGTRLPAEALRRTYSATVTQNGSKLHVTLSGADFILSGGKGNSFGGSVDGDRVVFSLQFGLVLLLLLWLLPVRGVRHLRTSDVHHCTARGRHCVRQPQWQRHHWVPGWLHCGVARSDHAILLQHHRVPFPEASLRDAEAIVMRREGTLLILLAALSAACTSGTRPRNVVLITLDTMRADRLPPYGFGGVATPTLDRLAAEGVVFDEAYAAVPLTLPSHATLFTGLYPLGSRFTTTRERRWRTSSRRSPKCLARAGWRPPRSCRRLSLRRGVAWSRDSTRTALESRAARVPGAPGGRLRRSWTSRSSG